MAQLSERGGNESRVLNSLEIQNFQLFFSFSPFVYCRYRTEGKEENDFLRPTIFNFISHISCLTGMVPCKERVTVKRYLLSTRPTITCPQLGIIFHIFPVLVRLPFLLRLQVYSTRTSDSTVCACSSPVILLEE